MFTDFYIANSNQAEAIASVEDVDYPRLTLHSVTEFELITLSELLLDGKPHRPQLAFANEAEGVYVLIADPDLVRELSVLKDVQIPVVGGKWASTEEFAGVPAEQVQEMLSSLVGFAAQAQEAGRQVLYVTAI
jgi:hypothetical protein